MLYEAAVLLHEAASLLHNAAVFLHDPAASLHNVAVSLWKATVAGNLGRNPDFTGLPGFWSMLLLRLARGVIKTWSKNRDNATWLTQPSA